MGFWKNLFGGDNSSSTDATTTKASSTVTDILSTEITPSTTEENAGSSTETFMHKTFGDFYEKYPGIVIREVNPMPGHDIIPEFGLTPKRAKKYAMHKSIKIDWHIDQYSKDNEEGKFNIQVPSRRFTPTIESNVTFQNSSGVLETTDSRTDTVSNVTGPTSIIITSNQSLNNASESSSTDVVVHRATPAPEINLIPTEVPVTKPTVAREIENFWNGFKGLFKRNVRVQPKNRVSIPSRFVRHRKRLDHPVYKKAAIRKIAKRTWKGKMSRRHRKVVRKVHKKTPVVAERNTNVVIPCTQSESEQLNDAIDYNWANELGEDLTNPRFSVTPGGDLQISEAQVNDSGTYKCRPKFSVNETSQKKKEFISTLLVYTFPFRKSKTRIAIFLRNHTKDEAFSILNKTVYSEVCNGGDSCEIDKLKARQCSSEDESETCVFTIIIQGFRNSTKKDCNESCADDKFQTAKNLLNEKLMTLEEDPSSLSPEIENMEVTDMSTCNPGFQLSEDGFYCLPCSPGMFSREEGIQCQPCPTGTYQDQFAMTSCQECPSKKTTEEEGAKYKDKCVEALNPVLDTLKGMFFGG